MKRENLLHNVVWTSLESTHLDYASVWGAVDGYQIDGTVIAVHEGRPLRVRYAVLADSSWRCTGLYIESRAGTAKLSLKLTCDASCRWWHDSVHARELDGVLDMDLSVSPTSRLFVVQRLALAPGQKARIRTARVRLPDLAVGMVEQEYTRLSERQYQCKSPGSDLTFEVDQHGIPSDYPGVWRRVAHRTT